MELVDIQDLSNRLAFGIFTQGEDGIVFGIFTQGEDRIVLGIFT